MKSYFDENGNLVIEPKNKTEIAAMMMWQQINETEETSIFELLNAETCGLKILDGNANSNAVSVTKSAQE